MNEYFVQFNGGFDTVFADRLVFDEKTGQKIFVNKVGEDWAKGEEVIAVAPIDAMVSLQKPKQQK